MANFLEFQNGLRVTPFTNDQFTNHNLSGYLSVTLLKFPRGASPGA